MTHIAPLTNSGIVPPWLLTPPARNPGVVPPAQRDGWHTLPVIEEPTFHILPVAEEPIFTTLPINLGGETQFVPGTTNDLPTSFVDALRAR